MDFETAHQEFMQRHLELRSGERRGRLQRGHNYAEKLLLENVWWPLFGSLNDVHPEYEVLDWNRKSQFLDLAFIPPFGRFGIECDGYQSHVVDMDREKFSYSLNRGTYLKAMGWTMIHFSFDDVKHRPDICRMLLQLVIGPYLLRNQEDVLISPIQKDVLRLIWTTGKPIRPKDVMVHYDVNFRTARKWLQSLVEKRFIRPIIKNHYVCYYELAENFSVTLL
jgi:hypothetical protein